MPKNNRLLSACHNVHQKHGKNVPQSEVGGVATINNPINYNWLTVIYAEFTAPRDGEWCMLFTRLVPGTVVVSRRRRQTND